MPSSSSLSTADGRAEFDPWITGVSQHRAGLIADDRRGEGHAVLWQPGRHSLWEAEGSLSEWEAEPAVDSGIFPLEPACPEDEALRVGPGAVVGGSEARGGDHPDDAAGARPGVHALDMAPGRLARAGRCGGADTGTKAWVPWSMPQAPTGPEPPEPPSSRSTSDGGWVAPASAELPQHGGLGGADWFVDLQQDQRNPATVSADAPPLGLAAQGTAQLQWGATAVAPRGSRPGGPRADSNHVHALSPSVHQHAAVRPSDLQELTAIGWPAGSTTSGMQALNDGDGAWSLDGRPARQPSRAVRKPGKPLDIAIRFDFFVESASIVAMLPEDVASFRAQRRIKTSDDCPRPALTFADAGFPAEIANEIAADGFPEPTPIQSQGWPLALRGKDLVGIAATGSGKTLAFMLPALVHARAQPAPSPPGEAGEGPIVLVLAPTRELACQIRDECTRYMRGSKLNCVCLYGGASRRAQVHEVQTLCPHAVIATPGRLLDLLESGITTLARVTYLVLDEADRMLEMGFKHHLDSILAQVRTERQTIMTSATWPEDMVSFARNYLRPNHEEIHIGRTGTASMNIEQRVIACRADNKLPVLEQVLNELKPGQPGRKILVFVRTKRGTEDVARAMRRSGFDAETMHADRSQQERDAVIARFRRESTMLLFATDVAQRGLDIKGVSHVVNFDLPDRLDDYIHRIGRTGRAGESGSAVSFCSDGDALLPSLVALFDESKLPVPTEVRAMAASCFGNARGSGGDGSSYGKGSEHSVNLADLKSELGQLSKLQCHAGGSDSGNGSGTDRAGGNGEVRMLVSNLPTSPGPLQDVQKFIFEKELRKLFAFCGPIDAMGFETTNRLDAVHADGDATCPPHESAHFTGTVWIDFKAAADAAYAKRMYDGYSMISGSPLGTRLHCALVDDSGKQPPLQHPMQQTLGNTTVPPLQEYLQVGFGVSHTVDHTQADPEAEPASSPIAVISTETTNQVAICICSNSTTSATHPTPEHADGGKGQPVDCARMKSLWKDLTGAEQRAAACLGWSQETWEAGAGPTTGVTGWKTMNKLEQMAAAALGYTQESWDAESG